MPDPEYRSRLADRDGLLLMMQGFAACGDLEVREAVRGAFGRLWTTVTELSGLDPLRVKTFIAYGMLLNDLAVIDVDAVDAAWARDSRTPIPIEVGHPVVAAARELSAPETRPVDVNRARLERMKRELALDHAAGRIDDKTYLAQIAVLREEATRIDSGERPATGIAPDKVVAKLQALPKTWAQATPAGRAEVLHSIYERIVVRGPEFVGARLTPEAYSLGLALALPERVRPAQEWVLARPTAFNRADAMDIRSRSGADSCLMAEGA